MSERPTTEHAKQDAEWIGRLKETFPPDALERLMRAEQDYYKTHGQYVPGLARLALHYRAELLALAALMAEEARRAVGESDSDYSAAFQDEYQRLWHEAAGERDRAGRILDWIGVAGGLPLSERVKWLAVELACKQGYSLDEAERLANVAAVGSAAQEETR